MTPHSEHILVDTRVYEVMQLRRCAYECCREVKCKPCLAKRVLSLEPYKASPVKADYEIRSAGSGNMPEGFLGSAGFYSESSESNEDVKNSRQVPSRCSAAQSRRRRFPCAAGQVSIRSSAASTLRSTPGLPLCHV